MSEGGLLGRPSGGSSLPDLSGNTGKVLTVNAGEDGTEWAAGPAPAAAGADTQVIFNDGGVLAGDAGLTFDKTTNGLSSTGPLTLTPTADVVPLTARAYSSGVGHIAQFQDSANGALSHISHTGVFVGDVTGDVTGDVSGSSGSCTGNAATATAAADGLTSASGTAPLTLTLAAKGLTGSVAVATGDAGAGGTAGLVPAPAAGDAAKFLRGDMTYVAGGGGGITNSAGANVLTKSDGTNLVASALSETSAGVLVTSAGTALSVTATAPAATTGASQAGKSISMVASPAVASTDTAGAATGGGFAYTGGAAARNTSGNADGGSFVYTGGAGIGTGARGTFQAPGAGSGSTAIGSGAVVTGGNGIAIGPAATTGTGVSIGYIASSGAGNVAIGQSSPTATATTGGGVAIGWGANAGAYDSLVFGRASAATATNQFVAGSRVTAATGKITDVFFGSGVQNAVPEAFTLHGTNGVGTDIVGASPSIASGNGTGAANASVVSIKGDALGGTTGTTAHASVTRAVFNLSGKSLTSGAASSLFEVPLAASPSSSGGQVLYTIRATDGTDEQVATGIVNWVARRTGAGPTYASSTTVVNETASGSSGALSTAWAFVDGTNKTTLQVTPTSTTITPTLIEIVCEVHSQGRSDIVPLPF